MAATGDAPAADRTAPGRDQVAAAKRALRARLRAERAAAPAPLRERADARIAELVAGSRDFRRARAVFAYLSFASEVETRGIIRAAREAGKAVALPRVAGPRALRWYRVDDLRGLERSPLGMEEPPEDPAREVDPGAFAAGAGGGEGALALVPGLAFDRSGYRLGYGGGYYDAFLAAFPGRSMGLCRAGQLVGSLDRAGALMPYDRAVDLVATEEGLIVP